jgi:hypothetical protein
MSLGDFLGNQSKLTPTTFEAKPRYRSVPDANVKPPSSPSQMSRMEPIKVEWGVSASGMSMVMWRRLHCGYIYAFRMRTMDVGN